MYITCPKCNYKRQDTDKSSKDECPSCGLIFSKWLQNLVDEPEHGDFENTISQRTNFGPSLLKFFFRPRESIGKPELFGYGILWLVFAWWGIGFVMMDFQTSEIMRSWFHNVDLIFHEAGHMIFMPFGRIMSIMGGSLFQILVPLILMFAFLIKNKDSFGASLSLWWVEQSMMDIAPYIADARALRLPLLGGTTGADSIGRHDWRMILGNWGQLQNDTQIAATVDFLESGVLLIALAWGVIMLFIYSRNLID
ncbi:MAG: hypothetical protein GKR91_10930 [Pseudomonadales bacterium]|nr:hypothetical protein [Pseudomonadales bacterium]